MHVALSRAARNGWPSLCGGCALKENEIQFLFFCFRDLRADKVAFFFPASVVTCLSYIADEKEAGCSCAEGVEARERAGDEARQRRRRGETTRVNRRTAEWP